MIVNSRNSYDEKLSALFRHFVEIPEATINACNIALDILNTTKLQQEPKKIVTRIINTPGLDHVKNASSSNIGKFLKIRCKVISVSAPKVYIKNIVRTLPCFSNFSRRCSAKSAKEVSSTTSKMG